jgi:putative intracellular protease/amidase
MTKRLAVILIDRFADWEHGFLTAATQDFFGGRARFYTPRGLDVTSEGGMRPRPDGAIESLGVDDFDGLALIGSSQWDADTAPDVGALLRDADRAKRILGLICKGTLAGARAGLLDARPHTSNSLETLQKSPAYRGASSYQAVPHAVRAGHLITAAGTSPRSFAFDMASALFPDNTKELGWMRAELGAERFESRG